METQTLEQIRAEERRLWGQCEELKKPYDAKRNEWHQVYQALQRAELREQIRKEMEESK